MNNAKQISILGATGSIGQSTLDVARHLNDISVFAMSGHSRLEQLAADAREFRPQIVVATCQQSASNFDFGALPGTDVLIGEEHLEHIAAHQDVNIVVAAIVGAAGLRSAMAAVQAGKTIALANKETLVVAGQLISDLARKNNSTILPVDSEHNAIFQALAGSKREEVARIILTASGGPFRDWPAEKLRAVTTEQALAHPTWTMGAKISIDSATMMNKALEVIEARWLFDMPADQIDVVVHPQSIVHSMVEYVDGSTLAQISPPDMRLPIQHALTWPNRVGGLTPKLDLTRAMSLDFSPPDLERFPALGLGFDVARKGGTTGAVLNAANESAVEAFLNRELSFTDIASSCREILEQHDFINDPTFEQLMAADAWARQEMNRWTTV